MREIPFTSSDPGSLQERTVELMDEFTTRDVLAAIHNELVRFHEGRPTAEMHRGSGPEVIRDLAAIIKNLDS